MKLRSVIDFNWKILELVSLKQPLQLLYHSENTFGVAKLTTLVPFICESNPWGLYTL